MADNVAQEHLEVAKEQLVVAEETAAVVKDGVGVAKAQAASPMQSQSKDPSKPATTTFQEDLTTAGQRRVNLIWEYTQAVIALMVVSSTMISGAVGMVYNAEIPTIISVAFGMVTGFYFSRTNHTAIGGIGFKPHEKYEGR